MEEVKRKRKRVGLSARCRILEARKHFTDRVSIDLCVLIIRMTSPGLMASLKGLLYELGKELS